MKTLKIFHILVLTLAFFSWPAFSQERFLPDVKIPDSVPHTVDSNGNFIFIKPNFTSKAYQEEVFKLVLQEANNVARDLQLETKIPIEKSDLTHAFISPFGFAVRRKALGNITTSNYFYGVERNNKFSDLGLAELDKHCFDYKSNHQVPIEQIDTNLAILVASDYLTRLKTDMNALNSNCTVTVELSRMFNQLDTGKKPSGKNIVPIYDVGWRKKMVEERKESPAKESPAFVQLFLPTRQILQLSISDEKYILRPPLRITNLESLFPGPSQVVTNHPAKPQLGPPAVDN